jgi:hypothetical protein
MQNIFLGLFLAFFFFGCSTKDLKLSQDEAILDQSQKAEEELLEQMEKTFDNIDEINDEMAEREDWDEESLVNYEKELKKAEADVRTTTARANEINRDHRGLHIFGGYFYGQLNESQESEDELPNYFDPSLMETKKTTHSMFSESNGYFYGMRYFGLGFEYRKVSKVNFRRYKITDEKNDEIVKSEQQTEEQLATLDDSYEVLQLHWLIGLDSDSSNVGADGYFKIGLEKILSNNNYIVVEPEHEWRPVAGFGWIWFWESGLYLNIDFEASYWEQKEETNEFDEVEIGNSKVFEGLVRAELGLW